MVVCCLYAVRVQVLPILGLELPFEVPRPIHGDYLDVYGQLLSGCDTSLVHSASSFNNAFTCFPAVYIRQHGVSSRVWVWVFTDGLRLRPVSAIVVGRCLVLCISFVRFFFGLVSFLAICGISPLPCVPSIFRAVVLAGHLSVFYTQP